MRNLVQAVRQAFHKRTAPIKTLELRHDEAGLSRDEIHAKRIRDAVAGLNAALADAKAEGIEALLDLEHFCPDNDDIVTLFAITKTSKL